MLTQDPIGLAGGVNLYAYAGNNPITFTDPFGLTCPMPGTCTQSDGRVKGLWANTKNWLVRDNGRFGHRLTAAMGDRALDAMFAGHVVRGVAGAVGSRAATAAAAEAEAASAAPVRTLGQQIAGGHAWDKHAGEFQGLGITTEEQFAHHVDDVVRNAAVSDVKSLSRGRTAYWDGRSGTVVIHNPGASDGGTSFRPTAGRDYFDGLK